MVKAALGKGMKDLLPKNLSIKSEDEGKGGREGLLKELETSIERYLAQGFDVEPLRALSKGPEEEIPGGMEVFRDNVKRISGALTVLRSLEGYGFNNEIEAILNDSRDTTMADSIIDRIERLKDRTLHDQRPGKTQKVTPKSRTLKVLEEASKAMTDKQSGSVAPDFDTMDVDSLMEDLADLGSAFGSEPQSQEEDPLAVQLAEYEKEGFFTDRVRELIGREGSDPAAELEKFQAEVERVRELANRLDAIDPEGLEEQIQRVRKKLPYTYMATDIEHDIDEIESMIKARDEPPAPEEPIAEPEGAPEPESGVGPEIPDDARDAAPEEEAPGPEPEATPGPPEAPQEEVPPEAVHEPEPVIEERAGTEAPSTDRFEGMSVEDLLEKAKTTYGNGDLQASLDLFEKVLEIDPENSKARFMIRRIGQKL